ncbi:DUF6046 domain-containing protein [Dyadobacter frigoris]|uniref:DUF6046 domain-containing protein n=1 Tax=Dyadobacter frigoris TaxID=2576211 RepID=A0A4U6D062_9BACT|nr:DUF6046 domain-containing protein [Dyadobacter frigoris]TKT89471.1 hypothetical protein FDK13_24320 [Dyadobacter frigoris]
MGALVLNPGGGIPPIDKATVARTGVQMKMPFYIGETNESLKLLPLEPLVAVRGHNNISLRNVAKQRGGSGTIKEYWSKGDYEIIVTCMLDDYLNPDELPTEIISRLNALCSLGKSVAVKCALFDAIGIGMMAITDWEFPPTENIEDQVIVLRGFSDQNFQLLIEK